MSALINVGTIGHVDAGQIIAALDSIGLVDDPRLIMVDPERLESIELSVTNYHDVDRRYCAIFDEPQMGKRARETWRERRRGGSTGVAKQRRQAKKRRSRR